MTDCFECAVVTCRSICKWDPVKVYISMYVATVGGIGWGEGGLDPGSCLHVAFLQVPHNTYRLGTRQTI